MNGKTNNNSKWYLIAYYYDGSLCTECRNPESITIWAKNTNDLKEATLWFNYKVATISSCGGDDLHNVCLIELNNECEEILKFVNTSNPNECVEITEKDISKLIYANDCIYRDDDTFLVGNLDEAFAFAWYIKEETNELVLRTFKNLDKEDEDIYETDLLRVEEVCKDLLKEYNFPKETTLTIAHWRAAMVTYFLLDYLDPIEKYYDGEVYNIDLNKENGTELLSFFKQL